MNIIIPKIKYAYIDDLTIAYQVWGTSKDVLIYVDAKRNDVLKKLKKRKNFNLKIFKKFEKIQFSKEYKKKNSQFILKNDFTNKTLRKGIKQIIKKIL